MLTAAKNQIKVTALSIKYALQREMLNKVTFTSNIIFMILNNLSFIIQWVLLYSIRDNIGGYSLKQVILLWGISAGSYGVAHAFFKEAFDLSDIINTGKLDNYLTIPKNVLLSCITSSIEVSAIGDMIYAYIMLFIYGLNFRNFFLLTLFSITGGIILVSIAVIFASLSFWFGRVETLTNTLNNLVINFSNYPEGIFKGIIKMLFYTIIPIGFVSYLPLNIITSFNLRNFIIIITVCSIFIGFAYLIFYKGLKNYCSSNLMNTRM